MAAHLPADVLDLFRDFVHTSAYASLFWTLAVLVVSLAGILWFASGRTHVLSNQCLLNGSAKRGVSPACPPELLKDSLQDGIVNAYTLEREMTVPFDIGDMTISKILVHPIKSCRGTSLTESRYTPEGLENDRRFCIIEADTHTIITAREVAKMVLITPRIEYDSSSPYGGKMVVSFPEDSGCESFSIPLYPSQDLLDSWPVIEDCTMFRKYRIQGYVCASLPSHLSSSSTRSPSEILSDYFGQSVHLMMKGPRVRECGPTLAFPDLQASSAFQDGYPFLVASEESLEEVGRVINAYAANESPEGKIGGIDREKWREGKMNIERFRPNIVLQGSGVPFAEDMWRQIVIRRTEPTEGSEETRTFTLVSKCTRCLLPNVDTSTGVRDAAVPYKVLLKFRKGKDPAQMSKACFGCNAVVGGDGIVRVGDRVEVKEWADGIGV